MVGRNRRLQGGEHVDLPLPADFEDGAAAVADVQVALRIEDDAGGHAHAFHVNRAVARRRHAVDIAFVAAGGVQHVVLIDGQTAGVHQVTDEGDGLPGGSFDLED